MNGFYRYSKTDMRRVADDIEKDNFYDVFKDVVPEPFRSDRALGKRIGDLVKFLHLTYFVTTFANPFESSDRPTTFDKYKRSI